MTVDTEHMLRGGGGVPQPQPTGQVGPIPPTASVITPSTLLVVIVLMVNDVPVVENTRGGRMNGPAPHLLCCEPHPKEIHR